MSMISKYIEKVKETHRGGNKWAAADNSAAALRSPILFLTADVVRCALVAAAAAAAAILAVLDGLPDRKSDGDQDDRCRDDVADHEAVTPFGSFKRVLSWGLLRTII